ncbi:IMPACT family protein [Rhizobium sp. 32-5/1]|uniref:IMPACT family protein n=1 Tax=Rhizobium sp. 32-5/1 TaxID=3019602 RepID=UPI00240DD3EB|nr:YigZ family protein [Rhizobium sp. 32-5/1]WEZ84713.1 IMPACT family protein [Rhizobium sp. 32-5/1]
MFTLKNTATFSQDIKKSRFLAICGPVASEQAAKGFLAEHLDPSATHNCWAWRIGQAYRFNDDGEPSGTAGKPILQAIDGQSLDGTVALVIRWFGGILLGSGGLMRAYGGTAASCLRAMEKIELIKTLRITVTCDFADLALVKARLTGLGAMIDSETFIDTGATLAVDVAADLRDAIIRTVTDITRGRAVIMTEDE